MDSKELTKALIAALPDTLEELTARLRQAVADPLVDPTDIPDDVRNMLLHSGRSDFLLTIDNVNADGSISCQIVGACATCGAPGSELAKERIAFWEKIADLENAVANREARLKASEREIERMRGAIANARSRIAQHWPDGPVRGSVIAFLDQAAYGRASLLREPVPVASNAPPGIPNKPAGMA